MAFDYSRLTSYLAQSKTQTDNNSLYQTILGLINGTQEKFVDIDALILALQTAIGSLGAVRFVNADTTTGPKTFVLAEYVGFNQPVVFKDVLGNAAVNNITLEGTVEGVVDPVINTNFGIMRIYRNDLDGTFNEW